MSKIRRIRCDACWKESSDSTMFGKVILPIIKRDDLDDSPTLITQKMDLCVSCLNKLSAAYYKICEETGHSGIRAIGYGREE